MRPWTIVYFERIYAFTLALGIPHTWLALDLYDNEREAIWSLVSTIAFAGFLIFMISRRRSKIAMWILSTMTVLGVLFALWALSQENVFPPLSLWIAPIQFLGQIAAIALLFSRSAQDWLANKNTPNELADTFS